MKYVDVFKRVEKKFVIDEIQHRLIINRLMPLMVPDKYGESIISNIYFDTDNYQLIRSSLSKPVYKEKLRLRGYGKISDNSDSFVEIKKKFKGVVYKRRISLEYQEAFEYLLFDAPLSKESQISREIDWFRSYYTGLKPKMFVSYLRQAFYSKKDPDLRITFDTDITWRNYDLDLRHGVYGQKLTAPGQYVMEIKFNNAMPMWLCNILSELSVYSSSYSKYGNAFLQMQKQACKDENIKIIDGGIDCA